MYCGLKSTGKTREHFSNFISIPGTGTRSCEQLRNRTTLTDKIGQSHSVVGASYKMKTRHSTQHRLQRHHTIQVTDRVLRQRLRPTPNHGFRGLRQRAKDAAQLHAGSLDELFICLAEKCIGGISAEESA
jgi:hypothetical protein